MRNSAVVAKWTVVSRLTGVLKFVCVGAVLGPTFFGNLFQSANALPNIVFEFLTGSLFASLLVPPLVRALDRDGDIKGAARLAGGFLGVVLLGFTAVAVLVVAAAPLVLLLLGAGVEDASVQAQRQRVGVILLALVLPQLLFYGIAGTSAAAMNARGKFALAAAAPALENVGIVLTLLAFGWVAGVGQELEEVSTPELLVLGFGATGAVAAHAGATWWGAHRAGLTLVPRAGWRDPEVRQLLALGRAALGHSGLSALRAVALLVVANSVAGGVVAYQLARAFFNLVTAVTARPLATALLPVLARLHHAGDRRLLRDQLDRGLSLLAFFLIPAALGLLVLAEPLARSVTFGAMATSEGVALVAVVLAAMAAGVVGDGWFVLTTAASYARGDSRAPFLSMVLRVVVTLSGLALGMTLLDGRAVLLALGLSVSVGDLAAAAHLSRQINRSLPGRSTSARAASWRALIIGAGATTAGALVSWLARDVTGPVLEVVVVALAGLTAVAVFLFGHRVARSPELSLILEARSWPR